MDERSFLAADRATRLEHVRKNGEYLGSRAHGGHRVHLYRLDGYFSEVWIRLGMQQVEWVEVARNTEILTEYVRLDLGDLLRGRR
ncbi:MAG: hypothetical protein JNL52_09830 [Flavobacteriales bacterium]|nr:hypothetical protein [Flavobacteriales bacterium]